MKLRPKDATHEINGIYYKVGIHGFVFKWATEDKKWYKSAKRTNELHRMNQINATR